MPRLKCRQSCDRQVEVMEPKINSNSGSSQYNISPPEGFDFTRPSGWPKWKRKFERFRQASGLCSKAECQQVNMLVYCLGDDGEDLLDTFELSEGEKTSYDKVMGCFEQYLGCKKNIVFERARFLKRRQQPGEPIDSFINDARKLAESCDLGPLKSSLTRDIIVIGVQDSKLSETLQMDEHLTLEKAILKARQAETMTKQQAIIRNEAVKEDLSVEPVKVIQHCMHCGFSHSFQKPCPARGKKCFNCGALGHFSKTCKRKSNVKEVDGNQDTVVNLESVACEYLGELHINEVLNSKCPEVNLTIKGHGISFKMDSGADVSVVSKSLAESIGLQIFTTDRVLYGPGKTRLNVVGVAKVTLCFGHKSLEENLYVLLDQTCPLLSRSALLTLGLITFNVEGIETEHIIHSHSAVFNGVGRINYPYEIVLEDNARPCAVLAPRRVAISLHGKVKEELNRMVSEGVIELVTEPTEWCSPIVVVPKKEGRIRLCVDYTNLNKCIRRELLQLPTVEECLSKLNGASVFSKLDAANGFWQVPLAEKSYKLTTFITPFGRYFFKCLPFGISSGPEVFQRRISQIIDGLEGVINLADDILVVGRTQHEHDVRLGETLKRLSKNGVKLNREKCQFNLNKVLFLGHLIDKEGIRPDPSKTKAILEMKAPRNVSELRRFLGMVNYLLKFLPNMVTLSEPLRVLLKSDTQWTWDEAQARAFSELKKAVSNAPVLTTFNTSAKTRVTADASLSGVGGVLEQFNGLIWSAVAYASRSLTETEQRYAQIEKEALGLVWACEKFSYFLLGRKFSLVTDHKPLVEILGSKPVSDLSARLQRFRMRLLVFDFEIVFLAGKHNYVADCLSRVPVDGSEEIVHTDEDEDLFVQSVLEALPCSDKRLLEIKNAQEADEECQMLRKCIQENKWDKNSVFWKFRNELVIEDGLLVKGCRLFIPKAMRSDILHKIHSGHLGIVKCRKRAQESVWWPGCCTQVKEWVANCDICIKNRQVPAEPLITTELPEHPWTLVGSDLLKFQGQWYIVIQDYYSRFLELVKLDRLTSAAVIARLKNIFARHGIPLRLRTDEGTQFASDEFKEFAKSFGIELVSSSPHYPQSNGEAENAVKTAKMILMKNEDPNLGLLAYRSTPLESGLSPAELLYGRKIRSNLPSLMDFRSVKGEQLKDFRKMDASLKQKIKHNFDRRKQARELPELNVGCKVWIKDLKQGGTVQTKLSYPRSYLVKGDSGGMYRRNRWHLIEWRGGNDTTAVNQPNHLTADRIPVCHDHRRSQRKTRVPKRYSD